MEFMAKIAESLMINKIEAAMTEYLNTLVIKDINPDLFDELLDVVHRWHRKQNDEYKREMDEYNEELSNQIKECGPIVPEHPQTPEFPPPEPYSIDDFDLDECAKIAHELAEEEGYKTNAEIEVDKIIKDLKQGL